MTEILLSSSLLILALALLRQLLRGRIDPRLQYGLWLLVALRLLIPGTLFTLPVSVADAAVYLGQSIREALPAEVLSQGPEGGAAVTLLAMAWLAAWLTWGAARSEAQAGADSAGTAAA